jgi:hypothetical protein
MSGGPAGAMPWLASHPNSHHVEHIYAKTGTTNRALASLFAANHALIGDEPGNSGASTPGYSGRSR